MKKYLNVLCIAALIVSCTKDPNADEPIFNPTQLTRVTDLNKAAFSFFNTAKTEADGKSFVIIQFYPTSTLASVILCHYQRLKAMGTTARIADAKYCKKYCKNICCVRKMLYICNPKTKGRHS